MNHPFFYLSIAAVAPFYCIFLLSLIRDIIRSHYAGGSDETPKKPNSSTKKTNLDITSIFQAHWVTNEIIPPSTLFKKPRTNLISAN